MTAGDALREGAAALARTETPFLDASLLLADALHTDTTRLLASLPEGVRDEALARYRSGLERRSRGLPLAYIVGYKEFWGRRFAVDPRVLVPRPDTETLVAAALEAGDALERAALVGGAALRVHEACCGSGCVAISVAADRPSWTISASDLSEDALDVARGNAASLVPPGRSGGAIAFFRGDLLSPIPAPGGPEPSVPLGAYDLILANPPYVPSGEAAALLGRGWSEPRIALDGGPDGLSPIRRLVAQAALALAPGGVLLVEADGAQAPAVAQLFRASRFIEVDALLDLGGIARVTRGRKPWTP